MGDGMRGFERRAFERFSRSSDAAAFWLGLRASGRRERSSWRLEKEVFDSALVYPNACLAVRLRRREEKVDYSPLPYGR